MQWRNWCDKLLPSSQLFQRLKASVLQSVASFHPSATPTHPAATPSHPSVVWFLLLLPLLFVSCSDETFESPVPAGYVRYSCNITTVNLAMGQGAPQVGIDSPGGYVRVYDKSKLTANDEVGTGGLLLLQDYEGHFYAFDLTCPYCYKVGTSTAGKMHRIVMQTDGLAACCTNCDSEFGAVYYGSPAPTAGPANEHNYLLRQYKATPYGDILTVTR